MSIIRIQKNIENPFVRIPRTVAQNKQLTWEARGLLEYLLSKPDGWEIRNHDLINQSPAGGSVVKRIIKELLTHGYIYRKKISEGRGTIKTVSTVFEDPSFNPHFTSVQFSTDESYAGVKPTPIETTDSKKQESLKTTDDFENSPITEKQSPILDPLQHIFDVATQDQPVSEVTGPCPVDQFYEHRNTVLKQYKDATGIKKFNEAQRHALGMFAVRDDFTPEKYEKYLNAFALSGGWPYDVAQFITGYPIWLRTGDMNAAKGRGQNGGQRKPERKVKYRITKKPGVK